MKTELCYNYLNFRVFRFGAYRRTGKYRADVVERGERVGECYVVISGQQQSEGFSKKNRGGSRDKHKPVLPVREMYGRMSGIICDGLPAAADNKIAAAGICRRSLERREHLDKCIL